MEGCIFGWYKFNFVCIIMRIIQNCKLYIQIIPFHRKLYTWIIPPKIIHGNYTHQLYTSIIHYTLEKSVQIVTVVTVVLSCFRLILAQVVCGEKWIIWFQPCENAESWYCLPARLLKSIFLVLPLRVKSKLKKPEKLDGELKTVIGVSTRSKTLYPKYRSIVLKVDSNYLHLGQYTSKGLRRHIATCAQISIVTAKVGHTKLLTQEFQPTNQPTQNCEESTLP